MKAILTYHEIVQQSEASLYSVTHAQFREHMAFVAGCRGLTTSPQITFDDGHVSNFEHALPLVTQIGITATFFVTPGWTGNPGYMSWSHLREITVHGHFVQSHSWSHKLLTRISANDLELELSMPKQVLEQRLGHEVDAISIPGGRWDQRVIEVCARVGYKRVYVSEPWVHTTVNGLEVCGRFMVRSDTNAERLKKMCNRSGVLLWWLRAQHQVKKVGRLVMGDEPYQRIWRRLANRPTRLSGAEHRLEK